MTPLSLDRVLTQAEALPEEEKAILEELLRGRRFEAWPARHGGGGQKGRASFSFWQTKKPARGKRHRSLACGGVNGA